MKLTEDEVIEICHKVFSRLKKRWSNNEIHHPDWIIFNEGINIAIEISSKNGVRKQ